MKLVDSNEIELSVANLRALYQAVERGEESPRIYKVLPDGTVIAVSVVADEQHYSPEGLERRMSPYLPPEAWAGAR